MQTHIKTDLIDMFKNLDQESLTITAHKGEKKEEIDLLEPCIEAPGVVFRQGDLEWEAGVDEISKIVIKGNQVDIYLEDDSDEEQDFSWFVPEKILLALVVIGLCLGFVVGWSCGSYFSKDKIYEDLIKRGVMEQVDGTPQFLEMFGYAKEVK